MDFILTPQQIEVAEWAVGAAPEDDEDFMAGDSYDGVEVPALRREDAPKVEGNILTIGSDGWAEDFIDRCRNLWEAVCESYGFQDAYDETRSYRLARAKVNGWIRAGHNLAEKVEDGFDD